MELTPTEQHEIDSLNAKKGSKYPMSEKECKRLTYLLKKQWHNWCKDPCCEGYHGQENETRCPKCKQGLYKFKEI